MKKNNTPSILKPRKYRKSEPWTGYKICPNCDKCIFYWMSSGMSDLYPHFYCTKCSSVYWSESGNDILHNKQPSKQVLAKITATLPECLSILTGCDGEYAPGASPKCPHCGVEIKHQDNPVKRLTDPHVILVDGASFAGENLQSYYIRFVGIGVGFTKLYCEIRRLFLKLFKKAFHHSPG